MFSDGSDVEDVHTLTINEHYAKAYEYRKEREELAKLKEKYGSDFEEGVDDEEDSEEAESEDEDGEELTPAVDAAILRTLARIKRRDPAIYQSEKDIFEEEQQRTGDIKLTKRAEKDKSKPLTIRQHALASALEESGSRSPSPQPLTHTEEQEKLRKETIAAFHTSVDAKDEAEEDDFLIPREKTKDEIEREEEEYRAFLEREVGEDLTGLVAVEGDETGVLNSADEEDDAEHKKQKRKKEKKEKKSAKSKVEEDQEFLLNYILNRGWIDKSARRLPTYKEITGSKSGKGKSEGGSDSDGEASGSDSDRAHNDGVNESIDEDEFDEVAERFESSYNFRFEEPGAAEIARYPRTLPELVRRQDTTRKEAREKKKARKEEELLKKKEEVKRLKALKLKELRAKLERIGHEGGKKLEETEALQELDLEGEWDPTKHDEQMAKIYANDEVGADDQVDEEKPQWDDDIDINDIVPPEDEGGEDAGSKKKKKKKKKKKDEDAADEGGVDVDEMDAEVERVPAGDEEWDGTEEMRKRKLEEYMDEVYGLDFNDMVGGMPTRFKYTKVEPQTFGLTPSEILMATDAELNSYMGIKKIAPYRKEGKGRTWDTKRASRLKELKTKLKERGVAGSTEAAIAVQKKRKGKKERLRERAAAIEAGAEGGAEGKEGGEEGGDAAERGGRKRRSEEVEERLEAPEVSAKKRRRKHKKSAAAAA
ncbi:KRI1-like family C-terminal-domain-containing protein [Trametes elegans]|nr:KRI1-like family C-terminal-domain-containing protein [Trametes elegans]